MLRFVSIITAVGCLTNGAFAGSYGDECSDAIQASIGANSFDSTNATPSPEIPNEAQCAGTFLDWNNSPDIWFTFTPLTSGTYSFTTCDPKSYDTSMVLYWGYCSTGLVQLACNGDDPDANNNCQSWYSTIEYSLTAGTAYTIQIGSYQGAFVGEGTLTITDLSGGSVWYVNENSVAPGSGTDWDSAFIDLQDALDVATSGEQIWIAQGTYTPTDVVGLTDPREASYRLIAGVEIYGGFFGNEADVALRRPSVFRVYLSGDLLEDDDSGGDSSENAYHVVTADNLTGLPPILDSVYVIAGNADGSGNNKFGGGLIVENYDSASTAQPIVRYTKFVLNSAYYGGAIGIVDTFSGIKLILSVLANNKARILGGAILNYGVCRTNNCLVVGNKAEESGGAVYSLGTYFGSIGSTIVQNESSFVGGLYFAAGTNELTNNVIWGNMDIDGNNDQLYRFGGGVAGDYNCIQFYDGNLGGSNNINSNPRFVNEFGSDNVPATGDENFRLLQQSPCIDVGNNAVVVLSVDLDGNERIINDPYTPPNAAVVDIGAYEHVEGSNDVWIWSGSNSDYFYDELNWLPLGIPYATALFNASGSGTCIFDQQGSELERVIVAQGNYTFLLNWNLLLLDATSQILQIDPYRNGASASFREGYIATTSPLILNGANLTFEQVSLDAGTLWLGEGTTLNFEGEILADVRNDGSTFSVAGRNIGRCDILGTLINQGNGEESGRLIGSMPFDISGYTPISSHDYLEVTGYADMVCSIELRWRDFAPEDGDGFDLINVGYSYGNPTLIYNSGLSSNLGIRWTTPTSIRGGEEVVVETTGPILFDAGNALALTTGTPSDIVVGDFNNDDYPDVAMSIPAVGGAPGSVVILTNNGMSGDTWLGLSEGTPITVGVDPLDIEVGDFTGDGTADDLVVVNNGDDSVSVLSNNGAGVFTKTDVSTLPDTGPLFIAVVDFVSNDALGLDDIVVACSSNNAAVLQNSSSLSSRTISFSHINSVAIPTPGGISPGDVTTDKDFDIIVLDIANDKVRLMEGNGDGTVATVPLGEPVGNPLPENAGPVGIVLADLDGDEIADAITVNETDGSLSVLLDTGNAFGNASSFDVGDVGSTPQSMVVDDFDNDGDNDLVVSMIGDDSGDRELMVIRNDTVSTIVLSEGDAFGSGSEPGMVGHGDFDRDGLEDIVCLIDLNPIDRTNSPAVSVFFNITEVVVDCPSDIDGDGSVAVGDILAIISAWGSTVDPAIDIDGSGIVDVGDILLVVSNWGPC
jgi:hypothetical protein